jgi:hypothetical protein
MYAWQSGEPPHACILCVYGLLHPMRMTVGSMLIVLAVVVLVQD